MQNLLWPAADYTYKSCLEMKSAGVRDASIFCSPSTGPVRPVRLSLTTYIALYSYCYDEMA